MRDKQLWRWLTLGGSILLTAAAMLFFLKGDSVNTKQTLLMAIAFGVLALNFKEGEGHG